MEEVIKGVCETQFGTAYEVYKDGCSVRQLAPPEDATELPPK